MQIQDAQNTNEYLTLKETIPLLDGRILFRRWLEPWRAFSSAFVYKWLLFMRPVSHMSELLTCIKGVNTEEH